MRALWWHLPVCLDLVFVQPPLLLEPTVFVVVLLGSLALTASRWLSFIGMQEKRPVTVPAPAEWEVRGERRVTRHLRADCPAVGCLPSPIHPPFEICVLNASAGAVPRNIKHFLTNYVVVVCVITVSVM